MVIKKTKAKTFPEPPNEGDTRPPNPSAPPIVVQFAWGYVMRKLIDSVRLISSEGVFIMQKEALRFQVRGRESNAKDAYPIFDAMLDTRRIGRYEINYPEGEPGILLPMNLGEIQKATASTRKPDMISMISTPDRGKLLLKVVKENIDTGTHFISVMNNGPSPFDPPNMEINESKPTIVTTVNSFCSAVSDFTAKEITFVKIRMYPSHMDWIGYTDDSTRLISHRFRTNISGEKAFDAAALERSMEIASEEDGEEDEVGSTFFLTKKTVSALSKIKPIPTPNSTLLIYHRTGYPIKIIFNIANDLGYAHLYIVNPESE